MKLREGMILTHRKYPWYEIKIVGRTSNDWVCQELHMGRPENEIVLTNKELRNYR